MNAGAQAKLLARAAGGRARARRRRARRSRSTCASSPRPTRIWRRRSPQGRFREDLYYRLERGADRAAAAARAREDMPALVEHFLEQACADNGTPQARRSRARGDDAAHAARLAGQRARAAQPRRAARRSSPASADVIGEADVGERCRGVKAVKSALSRAARRSRIWWPRRSAEIVLAALDANEHHISNTARELRLERATCTRRCARSESTTAPTTRPTATGNRIPPTADC